MISMQAFGLEQSFESSQAPDQQILQRYQQFQKLFKAKRQAKARKMYQTKKGMLNQLSDVLTFSVKGCSGLTFPKIAILDQDTFAYVADNFYVIRDIRETKFFNRYSQPRSELVLFQCDHTQNLENKVYYLQSVEIIDTGHLNQNVQPQLSKYIKKIHVNLLRVQHQAQSRKYIEQHNCFYFNPYQTRRKQVKEDESKRKGILKGSHLKLKKNLTSIQQSINAIKYQFKDFQFIDEEYSRAVAVFRNSLLFSNDQVPQQAQEFAVFLLKVPKYSQKKKQVYAARTKMSIRPTEYIQYACQVCRAYIKGFKKIIKIPGLKKIVFLTNTDLFSFQIKRSNSNENKNISIELISMKFPMFANLSQKEIGRIDVFLNDQKIISDIKQEEIAAQNVKNQVNNQQYKQDMHLAINTPLKITESKQQIQIFCSYPQSKNFAILTTSNKILFFKQWELIFCQSIQNIELPSGISLKAGKISRIQVINENMIFFCENTIILIRINFNSNSLSFVCNYQISSQKVEFLDVHIQPEKYQLLMSFKTAQNPQRIKLQKIRISIQNIQVVTVFEKYYHQQNQSLTDVSICLGAPLLIIAKNNTIESWRLINVYPYSRTQYSKGITQIFNQKPQKISVHPFGYSIAVVFRSQIKILKLIHKEFQTYYTVCLKNISILKYSNEGNYLLMLDERSKLLHVMNHYTFAIEHSYELYGIPDIIEIDMLTQFITVCAKNTANSTESKENIVYYMKKNKKLYNKIISHETIYKSLAQILITVNQNGKIQVFSHQRLVASNVRKNKPIQQRLQNNPEFQQSEDLEMPILARNIELQSGQIPTSLLLSDSFGFLLIATNHGRIKQVHWPICAQSLSQEYTFKVSSVPIKSLFLNPQMTELTAVTQKCSVITLNIKQFLGCQQTAGPIVFMKGSQHRSLGASSYFLDKYTPFLNSLDEQLDEQINDLEFQLLKIKDDINQSLVRGRKFMQNRLQQQFQQNTTQLKKLNQDLDNLKYKDYINVRKIKKTKEDNLYVYQQRIKDEQLVHKNRIMQVYCEGDQLEKHKQMIIQKHQRLIREVSEQNLSKIKQIHQKQDALVENFFQQHPEYSDAKAQLNLQAFLDEQFRYQNQQISLMINVQIQEQLRFEQTRRDNMIAEISELNKKIQMCEERKKFIETLDFQIGIQVNQIVYEKSLNKQQLRKIKVLLNRATARIKEKQKEVNSYVLNTYNLKQYKDLFQGQACNDTKGQEKLIDRCSQLELKIFQIDEQIQKEQKVGAQYCQQLIYLKRQREKLRQKKLNKQRRRQCLKAQMNNFIKQINNNLQSQYFGHQFPIGRQSKGPNQKESWRKKRIRSQTSILLYQRKHLMKNIGYFVNNNQIKMINYQINKYFKDHQKLLEENNELLKYKNHLQSKMKQVCQEIDGLKSKSRTFSCSFKRNNKNQTENGSTKTFQNSKFQAPFQKYQRERKQIKAKSQQKIGKYRQRIKTQAKIANQSADLFQNHQISQCLKQNKFICTMLKTAFKSENTTEYTEASRCKNWPVIKPKITANFKNLKLVKKGPILKI